MQVNLDRIRVVDTADFGLSLEAVAPVKAGDDIVVEAPFILVPETCREHVCSFKAAYQTLSAAQKEFLCRMTSHPDKATTAPLPLTPEEERFWGVLHVNAHIWGALTVQQLALFEHISLASHSCDCNAYYGSIPALGVARLLALRNINAGELVTICYVQDHVSHLQPRWHRQAELEEAFSFTCCCPRCVREPIVAPTSASLELAQEHEVLSGLFSELPEEILLEKLQQHVAACKLASATDDGPFHRIRALGLLREFHTSCYSQLPEGEVHFAPSIQLLAQECELMPQDTERLMNCLALSGLFQSGMATRSCRPDAQSLRVLEKLWVNLGGVVRDVWGERDPDYQEICAVFGSPSSRRPRAQDVVRCLRDVIGEGL